jgi:hypothetical protein
VEADDPHERGSFLHLYVPPHDEGEFARRVGIDA